jgi:hypothetical protein
MRYAAVIFPVPGKKGFDERLDVKTLIMDQAAFFLGSCGNCLRRTLSYQHGGAFATPPPILPRIGGGLVRKPG